MGPKLLAETIKSFQTLAEAWAYLEDQYGRADVAAVKLINDFKNLSLGKLSDHEKFMEMYKHFRVLSTHLNEIGQLNALNSLTEFNLVIAKLPGDIKTRYAEFKSRHNYLNGFALLNFFMDEQAKVSRECCVTLQATSVTNDKAAVKCFNCSESGHISKNCPTQKNKGQLRINGLSAKSLACGLCQVPHKVEEGKNKGKFKTRLSACDQFRSLSVNERAQVLADVEGCIKCTDWQHSSKNCDAVYGKRKWQPCSVKDGNGSSKCGKDHHNLLHGANHAYVCKIKACPVYDNSCSGIDPPELKDGFCGQTVSNKDNCEVLLIIQNIPVVSSPNKTLESLVFFDKGATIGLIRNLFAKRLNLTGKSVKKMVQVVGQSWSVWKTMEYVVSLVDRFGKKHLLCLYGIDSITSPIQKVNIDGIMHKFPDTRALDVARPIGQVDILVGIDKLSLHPKQVLNVGDLGLFQSLFGTGWILAGTDKDLRSSAVAFDTKAHNLRHAVLADDCGFSSSEVINFIRNQESSLSKFIEAETMGTIQPRRCNNCLGCTSCSNKAVEHSRKELAELRLIQNSVRINKVDKKVEVSYPAIKDFSLLTDNRQQALSRAKSLEKRLIKSGMKTSYDDQLKDFINRKAVELISNEEMQSYEGVVNYVDHHGVKQESNTTPYRFVVNSSLDNNLSGVSLNSCLPKGPNSIRPLFQCIVTFRSYRHVAVFDLSKAYQSMYTGEKEKHLRRIVWRFDTNEPWETYGFLRVTYGDRIAACALEVAKSLLFEYGKEIDVDTAEKMSQSDYVDDCNVGADSVEEIDRYVGNVVKTGDKFTYDGTVSQILGLRK